MTLRGGLLVWIGLRLRDSSEFDDERCDLIWVDALFSGEIYRVTASSGRNRIAYKLPERYRRTNLASVPIKMSVGYKITLRALKEGDVT